MWYWYCYCKIKLLIVIYDFGHIDHPQIRLTSSYSTITERLINKLILFCEKYGKWSLKNKCANFQTALCCYGRTSSWTTCSVLPAPRHQSKVCRMIKRIILLIGFESYRASVQAPDGNCIFASVRLDQCTDGAEVIKRDLFSTTPCKKPVLQISEEQLQVWTEVHCMKSLRNSMIRDIITNHSISSSWSGSVSPKNTQGLVQRWYLEL